MDRSTDNSVPADVSGTEDGSEHTLRTILNDTTVAGSIDPDAARNIGTESGTDDFAAAIGAAEPAARASTYRKTGRPKGSKNKQQNPDGQVPLSVNGVEKILFSVHGILSALTQVPELALDESEAKKLAKAIEGVTDQYKLTLDPKIAAYIDLGTTATTIYGPRAFAYYLRKQEEKKRQPAQRQQTENVTPIRPVPPNNTAARTAGLGPMDFDPTKQTIYEG